ncbi:glycoside hydrolase, family 31 domain protein, partial [Fusobacterium sp. CM21]
NVAVLDMDWHITEVDAKYGTGWTGYTWNRELFDDPKEFLEELHENNYKVTLNVHPADGIRAFEDVYPEFAEFMEIDVKNEDPILFDIADPKFREGYFKYVHHKLEADGVDFWWLDWQQGSNSGVKGLDPLWLLNHFHYIDAKKNGKRGLILSRYAGPGSHRYPVGFSGDTVISWESLDFQPYFTSTASNIGYGWWSHDIGGHMNGVRDDELFTRWVQFGVFSPIM